MESRSAAVCQGTWYWESLRDGAGGTVSQGLMKVSFRNAHALELKEQLCTSGKTPARVEDRKAFSGHSSRPCQPGSGRTTRTAVG